MSRYWLLKAEPDSRIVKGKDVKVCYHVEYSRTTLRAIFKFSVDDFEKIKTTPWEGVRNYEARNLMKEMEVGDKALFYHSNCKVPGIAAFAEVSKQAYPDYTAWDPEHPYFDAKTIKDKPRWYMVELTFTERAQHFVPLSLLRYIADVAEPSSLPPEIAYIQASGVMAIKNMDLVTRGRLSVQRVSEETWTTIRSLSDHGGFESIDLKKSSSQPKKSSSKATGRASQQSEGSAKVKANKKRGPGEDDNAEGVARGDDVGEGGDAVDHDEELPAEPEPSVKRKRVAVRPIDTDEEPKTLRRSARSRK